MQGVRGALCPWGAGVCAAGGVGEGISAVEDVLGPAMVAGEEGLCAHHPPFWPGEDTASTT